MEREWEHTVLYVFYKLICRDLLPCTQLKPVVELTVQTIRNQ